MSDDDVDPAPLSAEAETPGSVITPQLKSASIRITRLELLEYMTRRDWWQWSQRSLLFTACLWVVFMVQVWMRADIQSAFGVHGALSEHLAGIVAHPSHSGVPLMSKEELPSPCRCACRATIHREPTGPCDPKAEVLDFMGIIPPADKQAMLAAACTDLPQPLAELGVAVGPSNVGLTCTQWVETYGSYADPTLGQRVACSADSFEAYLRARVANPEHVNDTMSHHLLQLGDFHAPQWRCPSTCGICEKPIEHTAPPMTLASLKSAEDVWYWFEHGLLPDLFNMQDLQMQNYRSGLLQQRNLIVGGIRMRQRRAQVPFDCQVPESLRDLYAPTCRGAAPATAYGAKFAAATNMTAEAYRLVTGVDLASAGYFDALFNIQLPAGDAIAKATALRKERWLDGGAHGLDIHILLLNLEANFYSLVDLSFDFKFDGEQHFQSKVRVFPVTESDSLLDSIPELVWVVLVGILFLQELAQIPYMCYKGRLWEYLTDFWNFVDWVSILLGGAVVYLGLLVSSGTVALSTSIVGLPRPPFSASMDVPAYEAKWAQVLDKGFATYEVRRWYLFLLFIYASVITARFLKCCVGQEKLAMIQVAVTGSFHYVFHFQIICVVIFVNFAMGGHALFGPELEEWSTAANAVSTTLRMILGTLQFEGMYNIAPTLATIWLLLFIFSVVFLLMNLLTAILLDRFHTLRKTLGPTDSIFKDIKAEVRDFLWRCEWRVEQIKDGEYREFFNNPYADLVEGLEDESKLSDSMMRLSRKNALGLRIGWAMKDAQSIDGLKEDAKQFGDPAQEFVTSKGLRTLGCDPFTAEHLMEDCDDDLQARAEQVRQWRTRSVEQVRAFYRLLREHREKLVNICDKIETGVYEEQFSVLGEYDRLQGSLEETIAGLEELRAFQADSLALPPPFLPYAGTTLRDTFTSQLVDQPVRRGTEPDGIDGEMWDPNDGVGYLAVGDQEPNLAGTPPAVEDSHVQPALQDAGGDWADAGGNAQEGRLELSELMQTADTPMQPLS